MAPLMAQIFDPIPSYAKAYMLCCYVNATSKIQVVRITNIPNWYFERVVFPGQRLVFEALPDAQLELHCGMMASSILADTIPCDRLRIETELEADFEMEADDPVISEQHSPEPLATTISVD
jgi:Domain of unknown function (DUF1830)